MHSPADRRRRARLTATLVGGLLGSIGVIALALGFAAQEPAPPEAPTDQHASPTRPHVSSQSHKPTSAPGHARHELDYSPPVRVRIPAIGVDSGLEDLGLAPDGAMETPDDPDKAGWFTPSPAPGVPGASVIAGHVTWNADHAVFFDLGALRRGDKVLVRRADGVTVVFRVSRIGEFDKDEFPTRAVYQRVHEPQLRLITCGGAYDEETNNYLANVIVWATMVGTR